MYLKEGKDGYQMLANCEALIDEEEGPLLFAIVENHFTNVKMISNHNIPANHRPSLVPHYVKESLIKDILLTEAESNNNDNENDTFFSDENEFLDFRKFSLQQQKQKFPLFSPNNSSTMSPPNSLNHSRSPCYKDRKLSLQQTLHLSQNHLHKIKKSDAYIKSLSEYEKKSLRLCPEVEGRIVCIKSKEVSNLE